MKGKVTGRIKASEQVKKMNGGQIVELVVIWNGQTQRCWNIYIYIFGHINVLTSIAMWVWNLFYRHLMWLLSLQPDIVGLCNRQYDALLLAINLSKTFKNTLSYRFYFYSSYQKLCSCGNAEANMKWYWKKYLNLYDIKMKRLLIKLVRGSYNKLHLDVLTLCKLFVD